MKKLLFSVGASLLFAALNAALPPAITVRCGALDFKLTQYQSWNLGGIDFNGVNVCRSASYFGNVAMYDLNGKTGWVGSGHKDNNKVGETDVQVKFFADGAEFVPDKKMREVKEFELKKSSVLHHLKIDYILKIKDNGIYEYARITAVQDTDVKCLYLFMHPMCPVFTSAEFAYGNGKVEKVEFAGKRFQIKKTGTPLATYFAPEKGIVATTQVKAIKPFVNGADDKFDIWNRGDKADRKLYFMALRKRQLKAGDSAEYECFTKFEKLNN